MVVLSGCGGAVGGGAANAGEVSVDPLGTVASLDGHEWPTRRDGSLSEAAAVERPVTGAVRVDEDRVFETPSQLTFFEQRQGELAPGVDLAVWLHQRGDEGWFYTVSFARPVETWPVAP